MSPAEITFRGREAILRRTGKYVVPQVTTGADCGPLPRFPDARDRLAGWDVPAALMAQWAELAREAASGAHLLLGQRWPIRPLRERWHLDPSSGGSWPRDVYCFDVNYRHNSRLGDVKYVWELNRLQYLQPIAALALKAGDPDLARLCVEHVESWIDNNRFPTGVAWASGIELALRSISLITVTTFVGEHFTAEQRAKVWSSLEAHGVWLERFPSRFSSANNHRVAEGAGLLVIGASCPALRHAERWRQDGWSILREAARDQILPDGVGAEQSVTYTAVVLELLLLGLRIARACSWPVPNTYLERLAAAGEWLRWMTNSAGNHPRIGDDDNARVFGAYEVDETYVNSVLSCVASVLDRADLTPPGWMPHFRQIFFGAPPSAAGRPAGVKLFASGGYTVGRDIMAGQEVMLVLDHGPLGYLSIAAHGHADALALWLHLDGQPLLVDAGTYLYHSGGAWRRQFRGTAAHNTMSVEGEDASLVAGNFNWRHKADAHLVQGLIGSRGWRVQAEHDGYVRRFGATHLRQLAVDVEGAQILISDRLESPRPLRVEVGFLLHPSLTAKLEDGGLGVYRDGVRLARFAAVGPLALSLSDATVPGGWHSPTFAIKHPATRLAYRGILAPGQTQCTMVAIETPVSVPCHSTVGLMASAAGSGVA